MRSILGFVKGSWKGILIILALLVLQAFSDLSLPTYTSNIVDIGIQQNGIDSAAAVRLSEQSMENLCQFLSEEEQKTVLDAYVQEEATGEYHLRQELTAEEEQAVSDALRLPMAVLSQMSDEDSEISAAQLQEAVQSGAVTEEQLSEIVQEAEEYAAGLSESTLQQMAALFLEDEYEALGVDIGEIRTSYLLTTGGKMLALAALSVLASVIIGLIASRIGAGVGRDLRERLFGRVLTFSSAETNRFSAASLITRCTNDIQQVQMSVVLLLRMALYAPICAVGGILKVVRTQTGMDWIIVVAVLVIVAVLGTLTSVAMPKFRVMQSLIDRLNLVSREILTGIMPVRAFSREKHEEERFDEASRALMRTQLFTNRVMTGLMPMMMLVMNGVSVMIVWFGAKGVEQGTMQVGDLMAFINYTMMIVMSFMMLTMMSIMLPRAGVAADRINEVLHTNSSILDGTNDTPPAGGWHGRITFEDVRFRYPGAEYDALSHISFTAEPGKTTAIIGSTGCGKSTLLNLIPRFYDVTGGRVLLDGRDVRDMSLKTLRAQLGYVPQKGILFSGTIASNLKFADERISDDDMRQAAEIAQATEFIEGKVDRYESSIAQGGSNVSGGQKQRLSIARAIAKHPKVFLFDDSFSALDYKTDAALRRALAREVGDATVLIVAQRISTILHADQIIVLGDGHIEGIGTHEELLRTCATYQEIAHSQLSAAELEGGETA